MDERVIAVSSLNKVMATPEPGGSLLEVDWSRFEAEHLLQSPANVKNAWRYTSTSPYAFIEAYVR
jgi:hypothetical protein